VNRSIPIPELKDRGALCTVLFAGNGEMDIRLIGRLVAEATKRPLPDVTRDLRTSKGIIATELGMSEAVSLADQIERELQSKVLVVPDEACVPLPPPMRMNRPHVDAAGLRCEAYTWDKTEEVHATWNEVFLIAGGRLELQRVTEVSGASPSEGALLSGRNLPLVTQIYHEFLLDIVLTDPWRRLRLDQNVAALSFTEISRDPEEVLGPLYRCAVNLERYAQGVPANHGLHFLSEGGAEGAWESLTFFNKRDFDSYVHWLMQLVRFGQPIPA
jgi:hypothetical protein